MIKIIKVTLINIAIMLMVDIAWAYKKVSLSTTPSSASFSSTDETSNVCIPYLKHIEQKHGIPHQLLTAIAHVESGRWNKKSKKLEPWPWAVQAEGKGYYFESKVKAIEAVRAMMNRGITNIDIGCMQINVGHHGHAFQTLSHMFEPRYNVAYAGKFLKLLKSTSSSWLHAAGRYHSETRERRIVYGKKVYQTWIKVRQEKVTENYGENLFDGSDEMETEIPKNDFQETKSYMSNFDMGDEIGATSYQKRSLQKGKYKGSLEIKNHPHDQRQYGLVGARRLIQSSKDVRLKSVRGLSRKVVSRPLVRVGALSKGKKYQVPQTSYSTLTPSSSIQSAQASRF